MREYKTTTLTIPVKTKERLERVKENYLFRSLSETVVCAGLVLESFLEHLPLEKRLEAVRELKELRLKELKEGKQVKFRVADYLPKGEQEATESAEKSAEDTVKESAKRADKTALGGSNEEGLKFKL